MRIGVPKEIKDNEYRVGLIPSTVAELTRRGHPVVVETRAGEGAGGMKGLAGKVMLHFPVTIGNVPV